MNLLGDRTQGGQFQTLKIMRVKGAEMHDMKILQGGF